MGKVSCAFDGYNVQCYVDNARGRIQCNVVKRKGNLGDDRFGVLNLDFIEDFQEVF